MTKPRYSHSGICVSDLEKTLKFYQQVLGFEETGQLTVENTSHDLLGITGDIHLESRFLRSGGLVIELLYFTAPTPCGGESIHALHELGLTHLSFNVDDMDATATLVEACGGRLLTSTRSVFPYGDQEGEIMFVTDPDGTRIELMCFPEDIRHG